MRAAPLRATGPSKDTSIADAPWMTEEEAPALPSSFDDWDGRTDELVRSPGPPPVRGRACVAQE